MNQNFMTQLYTLLRMEFFSQVRMFKENLSKKLTFFICSLIILALILHLYHDFAHTHLGPISLKLSSFSSYFAYFSLIAVGNFFLKKQIKTFLYSDETTHSFAKTMGESNSLLKIYKFVVSPFLFLISYVPFWATAIYFFGKFSILIHFFSLILPPLLIPFTSLRSKKETKTYKLLNLKRKAPYRALLEWRYEQIWYKNKITKRLIIFCCFLEIAAPFLLLKTKAELPSLVLSFLGSFLGGVALLIQIGKDFESIWLERMSGVSHEKYLSTIFQLANLIGLCLIFFSCFSFVLLCFFSETHFVLSFSLLLKFITLSYISLATVPLIVLQIDPRKVFFQCAILFVLSLFFSTILIMNFWLFLLCPFVWSYAKKSQSDRFYTI